jgi:hypothetical protein
MKLIESKTLGTAAAAIEFTSIPQDGTDLFLVASLRAVDEQLVSVFNLNGSTSGFTSKYLMGDGAAPQSSTFTRFWAAISYSTFTADTFGNAQMYIPNYTGASNKTVSADSVSENNATTANQQISAHIWANTDAINSIAISANAGNLAVGSTISLYKITKGSDGIVTTSP